MTPVRWRKINDIFHSALDRPAEQRPAFLEEACADDEDMRKQVEHMLAADGKDTVVGRSDVWAFAGLLTRDESLAGRMFGHYRVEREIGHGGMGRVYLADDTRLNRPVALKLLSDAFSDNPERVRRFQQEARVVSALNHPNIITIHEIGETDGLRFIVTEFVDGETLGEIIGRGRPAIADLIKIIVQVTEALKAAHAAGIVHRDIKPDNIMVRRDGYVKVLDFGIAKLSHERAAGAQTSPVETAPGMVVGTVKYMSPEQARGYDVDARTDIFSLGVVLYEAVTGHAPFQGKTTPDILIAIAGQEPPPIADYAPDAPPELQRIIDTALRKERNERYGTMEEMRSDLEKQKEQMATHSGREHAYSTAAVPARTTSSAEYIIKGIKRHKLIAIVCVLSIVAAVALLVYFGKPVTRRIDSIAVLPFSYSSNTPATAGEGDPEYLSDGITEGLINSLSQVPGLKVIARSSVFRYKGNETDVRTAAAALAVRTILTGRVVQRGDNLKISVELIDAPNNTHLWGHQYDFPVSDLGLMPREIAGRISEALRFQLSDEDRKRLETRYTENAEAYQIYLQARYFWNKRTAADITRSIDLYNQAIAIDPGYALAYAGLASANALLADYTDTPVAEGATATRTAARKALQLDDHLAEAHTALAEIMTDYDRDRAGAEREFKRAIEVDPNNATAHHWYALFLADSSRFDDAHREVENARELDPVSMSINTAAGSIYYDGREYDRAIQGLKKALELNKNPGTMIHLGLAYEAMGRYAEALAEFQEATSLKEKDVARTYWMARTYALMGQQAKANQMIEEGKAQEKAKERSLPHYELALVYEALGDKDKAFALLEELFNGRAPSLRSLGVDPRLDNLRSDPRFQSLLERLGFGR